MHPNPSTEVTIPHQIADWHNSIRSRISYPCATASIGSLQIECHKVSVDPPRHPSGASAPEREKQLGWLGSTYCCLQHIPWYTSQTGSRCRPAAPSFAVPHPGTSSRTGRRSCYNDGNKTAECWPLQDRQFCASRDARAMAHLPRLYSLTLSSLANRLCFPVSWLIRAFTGWSGDLHSCRASWRIPHHA